MDEIRQRLKRAMGDMRAADLARATNTPPATISRYLKNMDMSVAFVVRACDALGVTLDWLLAGRGPMKRGEVDLSAVHMDQLYAEQARRINALNATLADLAALADQHFDKTDVTPSVTDRKDDS